MIINGMDVRRLQDELEEKFEAGYMWSVLEYSEATQKFQQVHLYHSEDQAIEVCQSNVGGDTKVRIIDTDLLKGLMADIAETDKTRDDIDYYYINISSFTFSSILKVNPDQNPLHNPDGNDFTDELIAHWENKGSGNTVDRATLLYPFIETELMNFPITELDNYGTRNSLVRALDEEHLRVVTFEKTFVPAELIEEYVIIDQRPLDGIFSPGKIKVVNSFKTLAEAQQSFDTLAKTGEEAGGMSYQLLIGRYHNQKVEFNDEGDVHCNTGLVIDIEVAGIRSSYGNKYPVNPNENMTVREHMYGRFDQANNAMVYYDFSTLKMKTPDKEFWNRENVSLKKSQKEHNPIISDDNSLLSKTRENNGKGIKR